MKVLRHTVEWVVLESISNEMLFRLHLRFDCSPPFFALIAIHLGVVGSVLVTGPNDRG